MKSTISSSLGKGSDHDAAASGTGSQRRIDPLRTQYRISNKPSQRQLQYHRILQGGLKRLDESKSSFQIAGHEIVLQEQIGNAAEFLQWAKDWIDDAIEASSEATLAWTVICIGLPFLTKPAAADKANLDGFKYISSRMRYYIALESLLSPKDPMADLVPGDLKNAVEANIIELYQRILNFQIKTVLRLYKSSLTRFVEGIRGKDDWTEMRASIEALEDIVYKDAQQISSLCSGRRLEELTKELSRLKDLAKQGAASLNTMQRMLALEEQHLKVSEDLRDISTEQRDIQKQHLELTRDMTGRGRYNEGNYHLLFRVKGGTQDNKNDGDYEWYKNRIESRVEGTCKWFLDHPKYKTWTSEPCGPLIVSADPGCGKSVLAKYLIDHELPGEATVCYFFFKDQDQNTIQQALRALLHQLLVQKPVLARHVRSEYRRSGSNLVNYTSSLWKIFEGAMHDKAAGSVTFILDALDECAEPDLKELIEMLKQQFERMQNPNTSKIKFLLTSRPYEQIMANFRELVDTFPYLHIPGEEASEQISKEVNCVIEHRVRKLAIDQGFNTKVEQALRERLLRIQHRTYLWVYLVFNYIEEEGLEKKTEKGVETSLATLPKNVNEAYEKILNKVVSGHQDWVNKALCIIVAATRAFTLEEMNVAVNIEASAESAPDLDLEEEQTFAGRLRHRCGLFVSTYNGRVYLLHQTAREFLIDELSELELARLPPWRWRGCMDMKMANTTIAGTCIESLCFIANAYSDSSKSEDKSYTMPTRLVSYAVSNWLKHFRGAGSHNRKALASSAFRLFSRKLNYKRYWFADWSRENLSRRRPRVSCNELIIASYFGLDEIVELLLQESVPDVLEVEYLSEAAHWAITEGHAATIRVLLDGGIDPNIRDCMGVTPLFQAVENWNAEVVRLLIDRGADPNIRDREGMTPFFHAVQNGEVETVQLLLDKGANVNAVSIDSSTPLHTALVSGRMVRLCIVEMLLGAGADVGRKNRAGFTPLQVVEGGQIDNPQTAMQVQDLLECAQ